MAGRGVTCGGHCRVIGCTRAARPRGRRKEALRWKCCYCCCRRDRWLCLLLKECCRGTDHRPRLQPRRYHRPPQQAKHCLALPVAATAGRSSMMMCCYSDSHCCPGHRRHWRSSPAPDQTSGMMRMTMLMAVLPLLGLVLADIPGTRR